MNGGFARHPARRGCGRVSGLGAAWRFLTRVPVGDGADDAVAQARAPGWYPTVGVIIGAIGGTVFAATRPLTGPAVAAALAISTAALVTGAFHHDGLADVADAYGGGWDVPQRLAILRDSRLGTYGVMALVCTIAVQVSALASCDEVQGAALLVAAHAGARAGAVGVLRLAPAVRADGLGAGHAQSLAGRVALGAIVTGAVVQMALLGVLGLVTTLAVVTGAAAVTWLSRRKIGGVTGDALGAVEQVGETLVLVCGAAFVRHAGHWPWWR